MRDADHRDVLVRQLDHYVQDLADHLGVQCAGGLVQQHDGLLRAERAGDGDALLLATRQVLRKLVCLVRQADTLQILHGLRLGLLAALLLQLDGGQREVAHDGHVWIQVELLKHHRRVLSGDGAVVLSGHELTIDANLAGRGLFQPVDRANQRGLARAGRPDEYQLLALLDREVHVLKHMQVAEVLV